MEWQRWNSDNTSSLIEVGDCILHKYDDETLEVVRADEYANFAMQVVCEFPDYLARDGNIIVVRGANSFAAYEIVEEFYIMDIWICRRLKYQLGGKNEDQRGSQSTFGVTEGSWRH